MMQTHANVVAPSQGSRAPHTGQRLVQERYSEGKNASAESLSARPVCVGSKLSVKTRQLVHQRAFAVPAREESLICDQCGNNVRRRVNTVHMAKCRLSGPAALRISK